MVSTSRERVHCILFALDEDPPPCGHCDYLVISARRKVAKHGQYICHLAGSQFSSHMWIWQVYTIYSTVLAHVRIVYAGSSVADPDPNPDPDPPDPHVFGHPGSGSGSIGQRYGSGSFYH
jgi:hypothetical protein